MPKKLTQEEFIRRAKEACGNKFDFTNSVYRGADKPVTARCPVHGDITRRADAFLEGRDCRLCADNKQRYSRDEFIAKAKEIHGDKYDYSKIEYINNDTAVTIICPIHGRFTLIAGNHIRKKKAGGCPKCNISYSPTTKEFVEEIKPILGDKYDYSKVVYKSARDKICLICPIHGDVHVYPYQARQGTGCKWCSYENLRLNTHDFVKRAKEVHGELYDYSNTKYINANTLIEVVCRKHGTFHIKPHHHLYGQGCPQCFNSKGEDTVARWLKDHDINYIQHHKIIPLQYVLVGRAYFMVDFYLPQYSTIIEYNGEQHYRRVEIWHTEEEFQEQQDRDRRLREHCKIRGITLIEIPYTKFKEIDSILDKKLGKLARASLTNK